MIWNSDKINVTPKKIGDAGDVLDFLAEPYLNFLLNEEYYNGDPVDVNDRYYVHAHNKLLGIRIRQLKVREE